MLNEILKAIHQAESEGLLTDEKSDILSGYSGNMLMGSLQRLAALYEKDLEACYLEVGVFQGLTLLSVANSCPKLTCYGIDNFSQFDPKGENLGIVNYRAEKLGINNKVLINEDYEDALESLDSHTNNQRVGLYFVDGPHDYRSQLMCLELALPYLHDRATIIIDDCNYCHVRQANRDFLVTHPEFKLVFEAYTNCHPGNMTAEKEDEARKGWWNGVNILARDPENLLQTMYPPTGRSRSLYENEHITHAAKNSELAPQALKVMQAFSDLNPVSLFKSVRSYYGRLGQLKNKGKLTGRFNAMNTYSENLTSSRYNTLS